MISIDEICRKHTEHEAMMYRQLRAVIGFVENGTDTVVKIFQDDATREWNVVVGPTYYSGATFGEALANAYANAPAENKF